MKQKYHSVNIEPIFDFLVENMGKDSIAENLGTSVLLENLEPQQVVDHFGSDLLECFDVEEIKRHFDLQEV